MNTIVAEARDFWEGTFEHPKWPDFLLRSLLIRYMFVEYADGRFNFHATVIRAVPPTLKDSFDYLLVEYRHDSLHPSKSGVERVDPGSEQYDFRRDRDFMGVLVQWGGKVAKHPWYGPFLAREPFVGVHVRSASDLELKDCSVRSLPAESPRFVPFHMSIASGLGHQLRMMRQVTWGKETGRQVDVLERLVKQFDTFCVQQQERSMAHLASI